MTLDYKILGQIYYGPEIEETPEIPGTSGYYTSLTGGIEDRFVAVGRYGESAYSTDGINWTAGSSLQQGMFGLTYGDGKFIAFQQNYYGTGTIFYSTDGINWTQVTSPFSYNVYAAAYGNGKFVAVDAAAVAAYSTDGITWTQTTGPSDLNWDSMTYADGKFIVAGYPGTVAYSTDGINWTIPPMPGLNLKKVTYGNGRFVALGFNSNVSAYSTDGLTWTYTTLPSSNFWESIAYGNEKFVAIAPSDFAYSTDGINWTQSTLPSNTYWNAINYGNGKFLILSSSDDLAAYSTDGITWTQTTMPLAQYWALTSSGQVNTLVEVQISIGGQGTPGSYVEIVEPQVLYTVPSGTETTVTSIYVTNHDSVQRTYDLAVVPAGETISLKHHIRWDMPVAASDFDLANAKLTLSAGDSIYVFPSTVNQVGFTAFGVEKS